MAKIRLYDTRSRELRELVPRDDGHVGIYACGPTVYGRIHVGNARPFVVHSLLKRFVEHEGHHVTLVINITDVNDKIYDAANELDVPSADLAAEMTERYKADTSALGLGRPDAEPLASETIEPIVALIGELIERGHAYAVEGDVYFRVRSDPQYGSLSRRAIDEMNQGEGVEGADRKEDPLDFALWKAHKEGEDTAWFAPWGRGRPGWHIECSAMAEERLGVGFQIHGGGNDLVFPHHENEATQTRMARDAELAQIWMHNGMLQFGEEKMAKSVGNVALLHDVIEEFGRNALIMLFVGAHYRQPMAFDELRMVEALARVARVRDAARGLVDGASPPEMRHLRDAFFAALADDFNTPAALGALFEWISERHKRRDEAVGRADLVEMLSVLGLQNLAEHGSEAGAEEQELLEERQAARTAGNYAEADRLRDELRERGWEVRDAPAGPELVRIEQ
ncbi:MAG TPA: cysteine--tRNA ligase [Solirubrobacteraceae bacterium]|nr:cysteine--tRNA ligase [Solirubrobacteraceae bacterium]